jgi:hypothetical protein
MKVLFMLLWFFWLLILTSIRSDIYAATNSNQGGFLDQTFWATNPTDNQIIQALFGPNSSYRVWWNGDPCNASNMTVVRQPASSPSLPTTLSSNTIYVLQTWAITIPSSKTIPSCTAIVSKVDGGTTVYSSIQLSNQWMFSVNQGTIGVIIDNINFEWKFYANGQHSWNANCIYLYWSDVANWATSNISINNSKIVRCGNWIYAWMTKIHHINLTNIALLNNTANWISLFGAHNVAMNNVVWYAKYDISTNTKVIYSNQSEYVTINNAVVNFSNNSHPNVFFDIWTWIVVNNAIARIRTSTDGCIVNNLIWYVSSDSSTSSTCKVYGYNNLPEFWVCPQMSIQLQWAWNSLGWSAWSQNYVWCYNRDYIVNPIAYNSNTVNPLISWDNPLSYLTIWWCSNSPVDCFAINQWQWYEGSAYNYKLSFGKNVPAQ